MSAERIKQSALKRIASQGYDSTSLSEIAGDVGIKTPSIYAHFDSKHMLFLELLTEAAAREHEIVRDSLEQSLPIAEAMHSYLLHTVERIGTDPYLLFWLRAIYLPPVSAYSEINSCDRKFSEKLKKTISAALRSPNSNLKNPALPYSTLSTAFIGILRAIHAELLYLGEPSAKKTLSAMWAIFEPNLHDKA